MNILLIEKDYFKKENHTIIHTAACSLQVAYALRSYTKGKVFVLASQGSLYEKVALAQGLECIYEVQGFASSLKFARKLKEKNITCLYSFDAESARLIRSTMFWNQSLIHIHSENRYSENQDILRSKSFEKVKAFIFADQSFREYYAPSFVSKEGQNENYDNVFVMPLYETSMQHMKQKSRDMNKNEDFASSIKETGKQRIRFFIPTPILLQGDVEKLLEAFYLFDKEFNNTATWQAYFIGAGDEVEEIVECAKKHTIEEHIAIFSNIDIQFDYGKNDLCIVPVQKEEYLLYPILWAWQNNLPLLLTSRLRYSDVLQNNENVFIADSHSSDALYISLKKFVNDEKLREHITTNGRKTLEKLYSLDTKKAYLSFFNSL